MSDVELCTTMICNCVEGVVPMRRLSTQSDYRQILPLLAAVSILAGGVCSAQEKFPNELNSPIDEPQVVIPENPSRVPIRPASGAVQQSTDPLVKLVYDTREVQRQRLLSTSDHTPWQMMHGLLGLRQDFLISHNGEAINGLEWIKTGPFYQNESWFEKTAFGGRAHPFNKPYWFEGHINQSLAILSMCNVPLETQFGTPQGPVTMRDMLKNAQMTANEKDEVTWTLWALCTYLPSDAEWVNAKGETWSIERLVRIETGKKVGGPTSPCGGTHGLFALARARNVYLRSGKPLRGVWLEAEQKIQKYTEIARVNQNPNGSLSSSFFKGKEYKQDFDKRMASSGHVLEFLMMALPQERLKEQWVRRAIEATARDLMNNRKAYVSCSPLYHATDALTIYLERVAPAPQPVAQQAPNTRTIASSNDVKTETPASGGDAGSPPPAVDAMPAPGKTPQPVEPAMPNGIAPAAGPGADSKTDTKAAPATTSPSPLKQIPLPDPSEPMPTPPVTLPSPLSSPSPPMPTPTEPVSAAPSSPVPIRMHNLSYSQVLSTSVSPTIVIRPSTHGAAKPVISGEQMDPPSGGSGIQVAPVPLKSTSINLPERGNAFLPDTDAAALPDLTSSTASVSTQSGAGLPVIQSEISRGNLSVADVVASGQTSSGETEVRPLQDAPRSAEKHGGPWKATPPERRKPIVIEDRLNVFIIRNGYSFRRDMATIREWANHSGLVNTSAKKTMPCRCSLSSRQLTPLSPVAWSSWLMTRIEKMKAISSVRRSPSLPNRSISCCELVAELSVFQSLPTTPHV